MMRLDEELGLYDEPFDNPLIKTEVIPALSDEEVREMFINEWERKFEDIQDEDLVSDEAPALIEKTQLQKLEDYVNPQTEEELEEIIQEEPTEEEIEENFSTIEPNTENIFQDPVQDYEDQINEWEEETVVEPFTTIEEMPKYNIDDSIPREEEFKEINNDSFWRDHIQENEDDDLKKKS